MGGQWASFHILEHYRFNKDPKALEPYWELLTESAIFCESWLIPGPKNDKGEETLIARPATSPENTFKYIDKDGNEQDRGPQCGHLCRAVDDHAGLQGLRGSGERAGQTG